MGGCGIFGHRDRRWRMTKGDVRQADAFKDKFTILRGFDRVEDSATALFNISLGCVTGLCPCRRLQNHEISKVLQV